MLALHGVALWWFTPALPLPDKKVGRTSTVRFIALAPARPLANRRVAASPPSAPIATKTAGKRDSTAAGPPDATESPLAPDRPATFETPSSSTAPSAVSAPAALSAASAASTAERPLDLALRPGWRSGRSLPAAPDERQVRSTTATLAQRMTATLHNQVGRSEDVLADGTRRIRSGGDCWLLHPSRAAGLFPFEASASRIPATAEACE